MARPGWQHRRRSQILFVLGAIGELAVLLFVLGVLCFGILIGGAALDSVP